LGQFIAAHKENEVVLSMATDLKNDYLFTGDSTGYIKVRSSAEEAGNAKDIAASLSKNFLDKIV